MERPDVRGIIRELREIRGVAAQDVADAMSTRYSMLEPDKRTENVRPMTAEEVRHLEKTGACEASHETLFLLAHVLGVGVGYAPWFVDLIYPNDRILSDPIFGAIDGRAEELAGQQHYAPGERRFEDTLPITTQQARALYKTSGFVMDPEMRSLLLSRFLRPPFPSDRYQAFVTGLKDGDLYPFVSPGSIVLVDTKDDLEPQSQPRMEAPYYLCAVPIGHRCGWPIHAHGKETLQTMHRDGSWHDLQDAVLLGVPLQITWNAYPLERHDFWMQDHRDRNAAKFIREVRRLYPQRPVQ